MNGQLAAPGVVATRPGIVALVAASAVIAAGASLYTAYQVSKNMSNPKEQSMTSTTPLGNIVTTKRDTDEPAGEFLERHYGLMAEADKKKAGE